MTHLAYNTPATYPFIAALDPFPWMADALCAQTDPELFHPDKRDRHDAQRAKSICALCPTATREACLAFGIVDQHGIYGGLTARERLNLPPERRRELMERAAEWGLIDAPDESVKPADVCSVGDCVRAVAYGRDECPPHYAASVRRNAATHCVAGHPFDKANVYMSLNGRGRVCKACRARRKREYRARMRAAGQVPS